MTKKTRTILFFICLFLFALITPIIVLYSQGFRFDFDSKKITQTGGLFLKVEPKQAEVYLNGKLIKKTDFFFGSALIENLLPKEYKVEVKKEGYHSWEKNLEITEKLVTEAKNIFLFPENPSFVSLSKDIEGFWFFPSQKEIVLKEIIEDSWALKIYDLEKNLKSHLIDEKEIYSKGVDLISLDFSEDSKEIYLELGMKEQVKYFTLDLDDIQPALKEKEKPVIPKNIVAFLEFNNNIYYLDNSGYFYFSNSSFEPNEKINENAFPIKQETEYKLKIFPNYYFVQEEKNLYLFNPNSSSFERFFDLAKDIKISPDFEKIAYFSDYEIWLLGYKPEQNSQNAKNKLFLTRFSEKIGNLFWLNSNYLIFNVGNKIKIAEIDNRDKINVYDLKELNEPELFFNNLDKKLYILSDKKLYSSEILLP